MATEWSLDATAATMTGEVAATGREAPAWQSTRGDWVTVHAVAGTYESKQAAAGFRTAERAAAELARLLSPPPERRGATLDIYLTSKLALTPLPGAAGAPGGPGVAGNAASPGTGPIVWATQPDDPGEPIVWPVTRYLLARWFGPAAATTLLTDGIAGVVAARIGARPGVAEADALVRDELEAGRPISIFPAPASDPAPADPALRQAVATSFVAALIAQAGASAMRDYLTAFDPDRRDQAALNAFHRPLGGLEETWLTTLRRRGADAAPFRLLFRYLVPLLRPHLWRQLEIAAYMAFGIAFGLILPLAMKYLVDAVLPSGSVRVLLVFIGVLFVLYILDAAVDVRRSFVNSQMYQRILVDLQTQMFSHLQHLPHGFFATAKVGDLMSRLTNDMGAVQQAIATFAGMGIYLAVSAVAAAVTLLILSPLLGVLVILVVPLFAVSYLLLRQRSQAASLEYQTLVGQTAAAAQENLSAQPVIKAFRMEERAISTFSAQLASLTRAFTRLTVINSLFGASMSLATTLGQLLVLGVGGYLVMTGDLTLGTLLAFLALLPSLFQPVSALSGVGQTVQRATGALERVTELLDTPRAIASPPGAPDLPLLNDEIRLEGVSFSYLPGQPILRDLDLAIAAGHNVAIVGPSGCGKSTLVSLLMRFYDPDAGRVTFDGHDLRQVTVPSVRGQIGLVFQDTFIFDTTLRQNIAISHPTATDAEIEAVAEAAQLRDFVASLPAGYDTVLGERGVRMSGGQRQRLAIARALLSDPRILILDEATSALDPGTEAEIQDMLRHVARGRTTISITHRLASVTGTDRIYVMDRGQVVEAGPFDELAGAGGLFQRLYDEQMRHGPEARLAEPALAPPGGIPLFQGLSPDALATIRGQLKPEQFAAGEDIVRQGDPGETLYLIARGQAEVLASGEHGERRVNTLTDGDYFGEMALLSEEPRAATVRAVTPVEVHRLERADFTALLDQHPDLRAAVQHTVRQRQEGLAAALATRAGAPEIHPGNHA